MGIHRTACSSVRIIVGLLTGAGFNEFLPLSNNFGNITAISEGKNWLWYPWFAFQTGGQIIFVFIMLRAVEFRGKTKEFADKTTFIRRFGVPAFTLYAFHRYLGQIAVSFMAWISGNDYYLESKNLPFGYTLINIAVAISFISLIIWLWENRIHWQSRMVHGFGNNRAFPRIKSKSAASTFRKIE